MSRAVIENPASASIRIRAKEAIKAGIQRDAALAGMTLSAYMLACAALGLERSWPYVHWCAERGYTK